MSKNLTNSKFPLVSVVIVNYNGKQYLEDCLKTVFQNTYPNYEVIVVDNGSSDGSIQHIRELFSKYLNLRIIENEHNFGPAYARNAGIRAAWGKYVAFLDNDTKVHPSWLTESIKVFESDTNIGACQCKLLLDNIDNIIDCAGEYLGQYGFLVQEVISGEEADKGQYDEVREILAAKSAGMIARRDILNKISGFDNDFFIYMEETDLCWRIWLQGYKVILIPNSIVYHKFGTSSVVLPEKINYLVKFHGTKNYISTLIKNLEFKNLLKILPIHIVMWLGIAFVFLLKRKFKSTKWILRGILWNFTNYKNITEKRKIIQKQRVVKDEEIFPKILRKRNFGYFIEKLRRRRKVGLAKGWDKDE